MRHAVESATFRPILVREEVFVHFLQIQCLINANTDIVANHQGGEAFSINKYDLEWMTLCEVLCWLSEIRRGYEHTFICFGRSETPAKGPDLWFANCVLRNVTLCLDINPVKPQSILIDYTVDASVARTTDNFPGLFPRAAVAHSEQQCDDKTFKKRRRRGEDAIKKLLFERCLDLLHSAA